MWYQEYVLQLGSKLDRKTRLFVLEAKKLLFYLFIYLLSKAKLVSQISLRLHSINTLLNIAISCAQILKMCANGAAC